MKPNFPFFYFQPITNAKVSKWMLLIRVSNSKFHQTSNGMTFSPLLFGFTKSTTNSIRSRACKLSKWMTFRTGIDTDVFSKPNQSHSPTRTSPRAGSKLTSNIPWRTGRSTTNSHTFYVSLAKHVAWIWNIVPSHWNTNENPSL